MKVRRVLSDWFISILVGIFIASAGGDYRLIREGGLLLTSVAIGGIVLLGLGWTVRVDGASRLQLRLAHVLVALAPVMFWILVHRRS